jgi:hypothetical protein
MTPRRPDRPLRRVTETQRQTLGVLACLTLLHGRRPALDELVDVLRMSKPAVLHRLHWLSKKGLCQRPHPRARWAITTPGLLSALGLPLPSDPP